MRVLLVIVCVCISFSSISQSEGSFNRKKGTITVRKKSTEPTERAENPSDKIKLFTLIDIKPTFPGGDAALYEFLTTKIKRPYGAVQEGIKGNIFIGFIVEKDGLLTDVKIIKGIDIRWDKEVLRVVKLMPNWNPGIEKGEEVRTMYRLPIYCE